MPPTPTDRDWRGWLGRSERRTDLLTPTAAAAFAATLGYDEPAPPLGAELPPLAHWLLFPALAPGSALDADGHTRRGDFLPPVPLPRRMWAGGRLEFQHSLRIGDELTRVSRIAAIDSKRGRSGELVFVTVCHEISDGLGLALLEEQDIVFRGPPLVGTSPTPAQPAIPAEFERLIVPDPVLLFRYSALTFNAHRIHYDLPYATGVEGYPGLVVHGPLLATFLLDLLHRQQPEARVRRFTFRAQRPLFGHQSFVVCGHRNDERCVTLWARGPGGELAMQAQAELG
jgi:3-methylfumaryl-CoA hydratase